MEKQKDKAEESQQQATARQPLPLRVSEQMAIEFLRIRKEQLAMDEGALLTEIAMRNGLDPLQAGSEYLIQSNAVVFEVK